MSRRTMGWSAALAATSAVGLVGVALGLGGLAPQPQPMLHNRSCPVPAEVGRYAADPAYKAAWDQACEILVRFDVETQPLLDELGPLPDTRTCATVWDPIAQTCAPPTSRP